MCTSRSREQSNTGIPVKALRSARTIVFVAVLPAGRDNVLGVGLRTTTVKDGVVYQNSALYQALGVKP